jgi:antitoxin (DNA-binding transcriptional repressor) of toxin-antitoxin stability system
VLSVGVRELKQHASKLIRMVRENKIEIQVTYRGEVFALLIPVTRPSQKDEAQAWIEIDHLAAEIGARWPPGVSAAEAVAEGR